MTYEYKTEEKEREARTLISFSIICLLMRDVNTDMPTKYLFCFVRKGKKREKEGAIATTHSPSPYDHSLTFLSLKSNL